MRNTAWFCAVLSVGSLCGAGAAASAQTSPDFMGEWVMRLGYRTLFVLSIHPAEKPGQACAGSLSRPQHVETADAVTFHHVQGPIETEPIVACEFKGDILDFTVEHPTHRSERDEYRMAVRGSRQADMKPPGVPLAPFRLERATGAVAVSTNWDQNKSYSPDDDAPSNPEMERIFEEDQKVRQQGDKIDGAEVNRSDAERREQTRKLLSEGALHSGQDFEWASFVFQHGSTPEDYLLAHTLAIVALKKGDRNAVWIVVATLDRYLQSVHQPQIYGTQFQWPKGEATTQDPYNRTLISDELRKELGVPSVVQQQERSKMWDKERGIH